MTQASDLLDEDLIEALRRSGFALVPIQATAAMISAAFRAQRAASSPVCEKIWDAMVAQATLPSQEQSK